MKHYSMTEEDWAQHEAAQEFWDQVQEAWWPKYVTVIELDLGYGGPEEGGWWFAIETKVHEVQVRTPEELEANLEELREEYRSTANYTSVAYRGGDFRVMVTETPRPFFTPEERPFYE